VNRTLASTIAPVCKDVRESLSDDIAALRSLTMKTTWLMRSSVAQPTDNTAAAATPSESTDLAIMHLLYKISDALALTNTRLDLACHSMTAGACSCRVIVPVTRRATVLCVARQSKARLPPVR
jgi:hypothetical protein